MELEVEPHRLAICRLPADAPVPVWADTSPGTLVCIMRTPSELSIVAPAGVVPDGLPAERGWRSLVVRGPLDFSLTGVLSSLAEPLADAGVPIFALSTYDTDRVLVRDDDLDRAVAALRSGGHRVEVG